MKEQEMMNYGGDILKELQEYNMLMDESEQVVVYATQSGNCSGFLTIICCQRVSGMTNIPLLLYKTLNMELRG